MQLKYRNLLILLCAVHTTCQDSTRSADHIADSNRLFPEMDLAAEVKICWNLEQTTHRNLEELKQAYIGCWQDNHQSVRHLEDAKRIIDECVSENDNKNGEPKNCKGAQQILSKEVKSLQGLLELIVAVLSCVASQCMYTKRTGTVCWTAHQRLGYCVANVIFGFWLYLMTGFVIFMPFYVAIEFCVMFTRCFYQKRDVYKRRATPYEHNEMLGFVLCMGVIIWFGVSLLIQYVVFLYLVAMLVLVVIYKDHWAWRVSLACGVAFYLFGSRIHALALTDLQVCSHLLCVLIQCQTRIVPSIISFFLELEGPEKWRCWICCIYLLAVLYFYMYISQMSGRGFIDPLLALLQGVYPYLLLCAWNSYEISGMISWLWTVEWIQRTINSSLSSLNWVESSLIRLLSWGWASLIRLLSWGWASLIRLLSWGWAKFK